jgi:hypothetical protein
MVSLLWYRKIDHMTVAEFSFYINIGIALLGLCTVIGGIFAIRKSYSKETSEAMERLNKALDDEIAVLRRRVESLEKDRATQDRVIATIRHLLRQYGLKIVINGDFVTVQDNAGRSKITRIQDKLSSKRPDDDDDVV